MCHIIKWSHY